MSQPSTIIITGGTGSLGSSLARTLETTYPGRFHLLLTCRNPGDQHALSITSFLKSQENSHFSLEKLDLSDLEDVKAFAEKVRSKIRAGELPPLVGGGIVNSAAYNTFFKGVKAKNGKDVMYTVNCLAPALLARLLLPALLEKDGEREGALVVNVGSAAHEIGRVEYFEGQEEEVKEGEKVGFVECMKRYGSTKVLLLMVGYSFQRHLYAVSFPRF
jgi:NAD(P)-dependent dehydrogenase (short-subunit alcohol dehydrogenase family)